MYRLRYKEDPGSGFGMTVREHTKNPARVGGILCFRFCALCRFYLTGFYSERLLVSTTRYSLTVRVWSSPMAVAAVRSCSAVAEWFSFEKESFEVFPSESSR